MRVQWDMTVYDRKSQLVLFVEVQGMRDLGAEGAALYRRNLLADGDLPNAPYLLMIFPDFFYLWKNAEVSSEPIPPTYTVETSDVLEPYITSPILTLDQIEESSLEIFVISWISRLIYNKFETVDPSQRWVIDSGLYQAIHGGRLELGVLV